MFNTATAFNGDISKWDVSSVTKMDLMFQHATSFKHKLCEVAWVHSRASKRSMFESSSGSISQTVCTSAPTTDTTVATRKYASRRPLPARELIVPTPFGTSTLVITSTTTYRGACPRCGTFEKSGRVSCCAPGGAWFKNCGAVGNRNVDHRWFEGVDTCKRESQAKNM